MQGLDNTTLTAAKYSINFTESGKKLFSLHDNEANRYLFVNGVEIIKFKAKDSEIKPIPFCLGNVSKGFLLDNMKNAGLMDLLMILVLIMALFLLMIILDIRN